ncbi:MAG TPA: AAA family ATPase [Anaeromyxobacteraceae bacterium]|nr:AAA family ATPase [Anaeromyxobacteraceae bacterium]
MTETADRSTAALWARFRFSVVGALLSSPPARGALKVALRALAVKTWTHPVSGRQVRFAAATIERWYYKAHGEKDDPVGVLRRAVRKDSGKVSLPAALAARLVQQYDDHPHWSYQLHYDNLAALLKADPSLGPLRSYSTVRRYMQAAGMVRRPRPQPKDHPGEQRAVRRLQNREVRSYEAEYVGSLWHLDFHHGSLKVLTHRGQWQRPIALGILDDHSRLCCHVQWYLSEIESFAWRVEQLVQEGGFALISGESGTGKSVALRIVAERLATLRDVAVGVLQRPQSKSADFYRELGDIFAVKLSPSNRWGGFKALRERWKAHVASSRIKPVLLVDEAQEMDSEVLSELRLLSSADFDATSLLTVVLSGDGRLLERLRQEALVPLGTRIRTRLPTEAASREELFELLSHALSKAGNAKLMTTELMDALVDHCAGNYRLLMTMGAELLAYGLAHEAAQLDEKFYLELFHPQRPQSKKKARA